MEARSALCSLGRGARGDVAAERQGMPDIADRLQTPSGATNNNRSIPEDAAEDRLIDVDALDLISVHFDGMAGEQTLLVDNAAVCHGQLGRRPCDERANECGKRNQQENSRGNDQRETEFRCHEERTYPRGGAQDQWPDRRNIDPPMQFRLIKHRLPRLQYPFEVTHPDRSPVSAAL